MRDSNRPHRFPANIPDGEVLAWKCAACGEVVREFGPREPDDCPVDWRPEYPSTEQSGYQQALADVIAHLRDRSLHLDPTAAAHHADWIERELGGERGE